MPLFLVFAITLFGCMAAHAQPEAFPSTYAAPPAQPTLFKNATILTGDGQRFDSTDLYIEEGRISQTTRRESGQMAIAGARNEQAEPIEEG